MALCDQDTGALVVCLAETRLANGRTSKDYSGRAGQGVYLTCRNLEIGDSGLCQFVTVAGFYNIGYRDTSSQLTHTWWQRHMHRPRTQGAAAFIRLPLGIRRALFAARVGVGSDYWCLSAPRINEVQNGKD